MKRLLSILFVFGLVLSGCASSDETTTTSGDTLSYETENGTIEYSANPTIYADYYVGELLYLGADVVGADMTYPAETWSSVAEDKGVENISGDMEAIATLTPDLIITINQDYYEQYSSIAPTIVIPYGTYGPEEIVVELGKIIGNEDAANQWVDEFNTNIDTLKSEVDNPDLTVGIIDNWGGATYMYGANYGRGGYILYDKLGLKGSAMAEEEYVRKADSYLTVDAEGLANYAGDVLFIAANDEGTQEIKNLPTYNDLDAVKNNRVFELDYDTFLYNDPYSLNAQVDSLMEIYGTDKL